MEWLDRVRSLVLCSSAIINRTIAHSSRSVVLGDRIEIGTVIEDAIEIEIETAGEIGNSWS
jgi:hypothetical protein